MKCLKGFSANCVMSKLFGPNSVGCKCNLTSHLGWDLKSQELVLCDGELLKTWISFIASVEWLHSLERISQLPCKSQSGWSAGPVRGLYRKSCTTLSAMLRNFLKPCSLVVCPLMPVSSFSASISPRMCPCLL